MSDLMIVKVIDAIDIPDNQMEHLRIEIIKQKETGVIVLPWFLTAIVVPEDTEIKVESEETHKVRWINDEMTTIDPQIKKDFREKLDKMEG